MSLFSKLYEDSISEDTKDSTINLYRKKFQTEFEKYTIPSRKDERWKYANLRPLSKEILSINSNTQEEDLVFLPKLDLSKINIVLVDGVISKKYSNFMETEGLIVCDIVEAFEKYKEDIDFIENKSSNEDDYFTLINKALLHKGLFIKVLKEFQSEKEVQLVYLSSARENKDSLPSYFITQYIYLSENTNVKFSEQFFTQDKLKRNLEEEYSQYFNIVTNVYLSSLAKCKFHKIQNESKKVFHQSFLNFIQAEASSLDVFFLAFGSKFMRQNCRVDLQGKHAYALVDGLYLGSNEQYLDFCVDMIHSNSHAKSSQYFKGIARDNSCGVFQGQIIVKEGAEKTDAQQLNKNLLLDDQAEIYTKPQLKIDSDDVKCAHGATVSEISEQELLYLRSRGFAKEKAQEILVRAYIDDLLIKHKIKIDEHIDNNKDLADFLK